MTNQTPGPWEWIGIPARPGYPLLIGAGGTRKVLLRDRKSMMSQSDSRLIAAAPDLLAALEEVDAWVEVMPEGMKRRVRLALAKATGEQSPALPEPEKKKGRS